MRPTTTGAVAATNTTAGFQRWNSPIPYLFSSLALTLGLIAFALAILACSCKQSSSNPSSSANEQPGTPLSVLQPEMEPKIVVIMPGDENPKYLAKPIPSSCHSERV
ncbi:Protein GLUTAMINE DUMPER 4 [Camellia lanceoleosa]|uniref:Protein GLUTAMINE DUMPER 4 n=1 Tax=Camellia lanceoleosa TaxID=1840588 RepID=A0ACC0J352_9ERIC|nr:Protein GLUTAMINE DUMPER 4 [Camellia lanceoleosa]